MRQQPDADDHQPEPSAPAPRDLIVLIAAAALGLQNAAVRELAVPDATTTVLTVTLFAADPRQRIGQVLPRRALAVAAMLAGAFAGAALVVRDRATWALAVALLLVAVVCVGAWVSGRRLGAWQTPGA
jgi:hypothetical protein